jgi:hypothetical protein
MGRLACGETKTLMLGLTRVDGAHLGDRIGDHVLDPVRARGQRVAESEHHRAGVDARLDEVQRNYDWIRVRIGMGCGPVRFECLHSPFLSMAHATRANMAMMELGRPVSMKARHARAIRLRLSFRQRRRHQTSEYELLLRSDRPHSEALAYRHGCYSECCNQIANEGNPAKL